MESDFGTKDVKYVNWGVGGEGGTGGGRRGGEGRVGLGVGMQTFFRGVRVWRGTIAVTQNMVENSGNRPHREATDVAA